jgi:ribonuclease HI
VKSLALFTAGRCRSGAVKLYVDNRVDRVLHYHLGSENEHTVYEAEGVGIVMALYLLKVGYKHIDHSTSICSDSQALLKALGNLRSHTGHYILDKVHDFSEDLHAKQDGLINSIEQCEALAEGHSWKGRKRGVLDLQLHSGVLGHCDYARNEKADEEAKRAAQGLTSDAKFTLSEETLTRKHIRFMSGFQISPIYTLS